MAEFNDNDPQEPTLPSKRKLDPNAQDTQHLPTKSPKLASLEPQHSNDNTSQLPNSPSDRVHPNEDANDDNQHQNDNDDKNELDDDDDDDDEVEEEPEVDRKGKGILRDDKGKGKMIVEEGEEDDDDDDGSDDDDSDDDGSGSGDDSDFSDDPLAEVDLNNILPSRTRRRTTHSGVHIARGDTGNAGGNDDDSSDSDA